MTRADAKLGDHVTRIIRDAVTLAERQHVRVKCLYRIDFHGSHELRLVGMPLSRQVTCPETI